MLHRRRPIRVCAMWRDARPTLVLMGLFLSALAAAPLVARLDPQALSGAPQLPPSWVHPLGTDMIGRDVLSRVLAGAPLSMGAALISAGVAMCTGIGLAALEEVRVPVLSALAQAIIRALLAIPTLILALGLTAVVGSSLLNVAIATGIAYSALAAVMTRSLLQVIRVQPYLEAAISLGASRLRLISAHMLPNALPSLVVVTIVLFSYAMVANGALLFLGLGGDPALPEWGAMLAEGRYVFRSAPWAAVAPGAALMLTVLTTNVLAARLQRAVSAPGV